ncbi:hypothetical protein FOZ62_003341, partial [Perkinsus olseni]
TLHDMGYGTGEHASLGVEVRSSEQEYVMEVLQRCNDYLSSDRVLPPRYVDLSEVWMYADASEMAKQCFAESALHFVLAVFVLRQHSRKQALSSLLKDWPIFDT